MAQRYDLYLRTGRTTDVAVLSGSLGTDAWALLATNVTNDSHRIAGTHYEYGTQLLSAVSDPPGAETCHEMVLPYDYQTSESNSTTHGTYDLCTAHGFAFPQSVRSWRGDPGAAPPSTANVETRSDVLTIDSVGRVTRVKLANDVHRNDDDLCVDTTFAAPTGSNERVLSAVASRTTSDCGSTVYTRDTFEYDKLAVGNVSNGFPTSHTVERRDELGVLLGTIREFDATYDAFGNPLIVTASREDGATRTATAAYDDFKLVPTTITRAATGILATQVVITRNPVTLNVLSTTDPTGTQHGTTLDGFDRPVLSTVTPPGGAEGALSVTSYVGFAVGEPPGRSIIQKVFTDPVIPDDPHTVNAAVGRTGTVFLDELGRAMRTELVLGSNYGTQKLIAGRRTYDSVGRVVFEADPFPSTQGFATAYGTTRFFNADGTAMCSVRGNGQQPPPAPNTLPASVESQENYPTCFQRTFESNTEVVSVRDPASLLPLSPQDGVVNKSYATAIGWTLTRSTLQGTTRLEHATFAHDRLGHQTGMTRYQDAVGMAKPVTSSWHFDSLGRLLELDLTSSTSPDTRHDRRYGGLIAWRDEVVGTAMTPVMLRKIPGPDGFLATRHGAGGPWVFAFGEARGNRFFTDDTGGFVQDVDYQPYGEATPTGAQPGSPRYSNEQWNFGDALAALGIDHLGARLYDPVIGRFLSRDPLLIPRTAAATNPYAFAMNDPVNGSDPSGLDPEDQSIPVLDWLGKWILGISGGDGLPMRDPDTNQAGLSGTGITYVGSGPGASIGTSGYPASGAGSLGSGAVGGLSGAGPYPVAPGWFKGVGVYDRLRNYTVDGFTDSLSDAWANTTNGVSDHVGATHPGHATVVGDVRPGIQAGVRVGFDIGVQLLLAIIFTPGEVASAVGLAEDTEALAGKLLPGLKLESRQFGNKAAQHLPDFGRSAKSAADRAWLETHIRSIVSEYNEVRQGAWSGGAKDNLFFRQVRTSSSRGPTEPSSRS